MMMLTAKAEITIKEAFSGRQLLYQLSWIDLIYFIVIWAFPESSYQKVPGSFIENLFSNLNDAKLWYKPHGELPSRKHF